MNDTFTLNGNGVNNKNANKIKKQKQYKKLKKELRKSTSITPTNIATDPTSFLTPPSLPTTLVLPIVQPSPTPALILESNNVNYTEPVINHDNQTYESKGISAASIAGSDTSSQTPASVKTVHIVGPIIGIFAGIAFIAAAMFLVARNRKKRNLTTNQDGNNGNDDNTFHNISLDDEAITMPPLALDEKKRSFISTTTDYHSMAETLIGSRTNSVTKKQDSWQSSTISPTSTLVGHHASFLMVAERQQLQHEKPNLLDHFFKGMPIETYKAQLADILGPEEEEELPVLNQPLPFISVTDLSDYYK